MIMLAATLLVSRGGHAETANSDQNGATIILFGASWCAPCKAELRQIGALARAAAPVRLELAWIDRHPDGVAAAETNLRILPTAMARAKYELLAGEGAGLPVTVMIGPDQRRCAFLRAPIDVEKLKRLKSACR